MLPSEAVERARSRWPDFSFEAGPAGPFAQWVAERTPDGAQVDLQVGDLGLAWACMGRQRVALEAFERELMPAVRRALRRVDTSADFVEETANRVRERLLITTDKRDAGLVSYLGQAPLASFAMVVAMREAADLKRRSVVDETLDEALSQPASTRGADSLIAHGELRPAVQAALDEALAGLTPRQRTLLKLHFVQGVSAQKLAAIYGVHRATTTRWLLEAREQVLGQLVPRLRGTLRLSEESFEEVRLSLLEGIDLTLCGRLDETGS